MCPGDYYTARTVISNALVILLIPIVRRLVLKERESNSLALAVDRIKRAGGMFGDATDRFHRKTRLRFKLFCRRSIILESVARLTIAMLDGTEQQANENSFEHEHYQKAQRCKGQH